MGSATHSVAKSKRSFVADAITRSTQLEKEAIVETASGGRLRQRPYLLQNARLVGDRPVLHDLAVANAVDRNSLRLNRFVGSRDPEELSHMLATTDDVADHEITFRYLHLDLVVSRG